MTPDKEKAKLEKRLWVAYEKAKKAVDAFPRADVDKVMKLIDADVAGGWTRRHVSLWDARVKDKEGKASEEQKKLLAKYKKKINRLEELLDAIIHLFHLRIIYLFQKKTGADLLEATAFMDKHHDAKPEDEDEYKKDLKYLTRNKKSIN